VNGTAFVKKGGLRKKGRAGIEWIVYEWILTCKIRARFEIRCKIGGVSTLQCTVVRGVWKLKDPLVRYPTEMLS
jgi:hypothetical protein